MIKTTFLFNLCEELEILDLTLQVIFFWNPRNAFHVFKTLSDISSFLCCVQLKLQLSESQSQLDLVQKEAQAHKEELAQVTLLA